MKDVKLANIHTYPIKSTSGIALSNAWIDELGLSFDRRFVVCDTRGQFITARTQPSLCLIQANITPAGFILTAPNMPNLSLDYTGNNTKGLTTRYQNITVWKDTISAQCCNEKVNQWFSQYLQFPCELLFFGNESSRLVKNSSNEVAFADGYPLLLISQSSLDELNTRSPRKNVMAQFRPNIVVDNCDAFAEDGWHTIKIGEVEFVISKPCSRCNFTTVDPSTGNFDYSREPLKTLASFRKDSDGEIYFGQNLIPLNTGQIKVGDTVEILKTQVAKQYPERQENRPRAEKKAVTSNITRSDTTKPVAKKVTSQLNINFESWDEVHQGNNQETLLEQGEAADLIMMYSCRSGMCGRCKVKLQSGEVEQLSTEGLMPSEKDDGYILACVCIPTTDVVITKN